MIFISLNCFAHYNPNEITCTVTGIEELDLGYCAEGLDGKGKCVKIIISDASRCFDGQQPINQLTNLQQ